MSLNQILLLLYSVNNDLENIELQSAFKDIHALIDFFEKQLPYIQDSAGDLNDKLDMILEFKPQTEVKT